MEAPAETQRVSEHKNKKMAANQGYHVLGAARDEPELPAHGDAETVGEIALVGRETRVARDLEALAEEVAKLGGLEL